MNRILIILLLLASGCAPDITETDFFSRHPDPMENEEGDVVLATHTDGEVSITVLSADGLKWGFNTLTIEAEGVTSLSTTMYFDAGNVRIESPLGSTSTAPDEPVHILNPGIEGSWIMELSYATSQGQFIAHYPVEVAEDIWVRQLEDSQTFVSWVAPGAPTTGTDTFEIAIHSFDGTSFTPVTTASVDLYPYMDMGGGEGHSTSYTAPSHVGNGHYRGEVNFIMSGGWDMTVKVNGSDEVIFKGFTVR